MYFWKTIRQDFLKLLDMKHHRAKLLHLRCDLKVNVRLRTLNYMPYSLQPLWHWQAIFRLENKRNVENPEMYAVFSYRLYSVGQSDIELGINALEQRWDKGDFGRWQDDIFMAYPGLTEQAGDNLVGRAKNYDKSSCFPAFWGRITTGSLIRIMGCVLIKTFQSMLMKADPYSKKIYLLPAWPKKWMLISNFMPVQYGY